METLPEKVNALPRLPGCYIFKNKLGIGSRNTLQKKSKRLNTSFEDKEVYLFFRAFNEWECIFADKYYVTVPRRAKEERITLLLEKAFREF